MRSCSLRETVGRRPHSFSVPHVVLLPLMSSFFCFLFSLVISCGMITSRRSPPLQLHHAQAAPVIRPCDATIVFGNNDQVTLQSCSIAVLLRFETKEMFAQPCENISIQLFEMQFIEGIDWGMCITSLRNVSITVVASKVQYRGLLNNYNQILNMENLAVEVRDCTLNLTAPTVDSAIIPSLINVFLIQRPSSSLQNVHVVVSSTNVICEQLTNWDSSVMIRFIGYNTSATNLTISLSVILEHSRFVQPGLHV